MRIRQITIALASVAICASSVLATPAEEPRQEVVDTKYFHEPGADDILGHYDVRYFKGKPVSYDERTDTLHHMIRAYLDFFRERGLETWIAHGTLLGWWWNGELLPWDWDLDTQVSGSTLDYLATHYNGTLHRYTSTSKSSINPQGKKVKRDYLLDVNPWHWQRERGDGQNIIDARWIDVRNGLYIDITGLSETHPDHSPGVWSCKNYHRYRTTELYPMRESVFEGVIAKIPYNYDKMLREEYGVKAMVLTEYEGHKWSPTEKQWIKLTEQEIRAKSLKQATKKSQTPEETLPTPNTNEADKQQEEKEEKEEKKEEKEEKKAKREKEIRRERAKRDKEEKARRKLQAEKVDLELQR